MSTIGITNYDFNKQGYATIEQLTFAQIQEKKQEITKWLKTFTNYEYIGLLCRDNHDYTVFHIQNNLDAAADEIFEVLESRGEVLDVVYDSNDFGECYQIWVKIPMVSPELAESLDGLSYQNNVNIYMYMLFNSYDWIVEVG